MTGRMLSLEQVGEELAISKAQTYALVRRGDLRALKIGGRGVWRVERTELEAYLERTYADTDRWVLEHPFTDQDEPEGPADGGSPEEGGATEE
jgi:excisionase family DNA binding protein